MKNITSKMTNINISDRVIGSGRPAFLIAEVAQAHDGSLSRAHEYIDRAAKAGADAIKFQTHIAEAESTLDEPFRVKISSQDATRYDYWNRMSFSESQWQELASHAAECGLIFLSSPFSIEAIELLGRIGVPAWKVGSGEYASNALMGAMIDTGLPILLSTGMSTYEEIEVALQTITSAGNAIGLFHCTSQYPTPLTDVGLNVLDEFRDKYNCPVGLSDHSGTVFPALAAMGSSANMIEVHVCLDRQETGPDVTSSLTFDEFSFVSKARDAFFEMKTNPVNKNEMAEKLLEMRKTFSRSIAPLHDLDVGSVLGMKDLSFKKPGNGIPEKDINQVIGKKLVKPVTANRLLKWSDIGE